MQQIRGLTIKHSIIICMALVFSAGIMMIFGCKTMDAVTQGVTSIGQSTGVLTSSQAESLTKSATAIARSFEDITPEQEYYLGRSVGAVLLKRYPVYNNRRLNRYINQLGQTLAKASDRPATFGGYHFLVLNQDEINAFAAPSGLIFVTRGMLRCCRNEDDVAAVLAHEIAHVQLYHGLQAIKKSRITTALTVVGAESAKTFGSQELAQLTSAFEDSIGDITKTLVNNGYSRSFENQADEAALTILRRVGYNPHALVEMLGTMSRRLKPGSAGFGQTHPEPQDRIAHIKEIIGFFQKVKSPRARMNRFKQVWGKV